MLTIYLKLFSALNIKIFMLYFLCQVTAKSKDRFSAGYIEGPGISEVAEGLLTDFFLLAPRVDQLTYTQAATGDTNTVENLLIQPGSIHRCQDKCRLQLLIVQDIEELAVCTLTAIFLMHSFCPNISTSNLIR